MDLTVTYVYHNCFCVTLDNRALVFDFPDQEHRNAEAADVVSKTLTGREASIFFSHSHADHCSAEIIDIASRSAASTTYFLSYDVPDMIPELDLPGAIVVEPGDDPAGGVPGDIYSAGELTVSALESNDLGVAFFIRVEGLRLYYGGDLAEWVWPEADETGNAHTRAFFGRSLDAVRAFEPDLAFTDCDLRLPNLAGFERFARTVRPKVLVPTHDFGNPTGVASAASGIDMPETRLMTYSRTGDNFNVADRILND
ncbi:MBL fold metallo-hydrolase [Desulfovibrio ferrophilus]|uniref:Long-chain-fatty-acid--CoA ligase n=1 Tax=Desulfovibrio ferrophilus TaxID=241368 RepID=A0A2Z6AU51_9BACT|nr:MBL fold metallo-hydrolase [Desulfovibrio ferrophilus]BBD06750.1 long-chain-fatty-acid--CoA ligase [Desulfovibrio ferrophilus]